MYENKFFNHDNKARVLVTDLGLGGLSVQAQINKKLTDLKIVPSVEIIYYNSLADRKYGYNRMKSIDEKVEVFDSALQGMDKFDPELILIACNTKLSFR